jgi:hypothetical protein
MVKHTQSTTWKFYQGLSLGLQDDNPLSLSLPSNHLIWYEIDGVMIACIILFALNVLQNPTWTIINFFVVCPNEKKLTSF